VRLRAATTRHRTICLQVVVFKRDFTSAMNCTKLHTLSKSATPCLAPIDKPRYYAMKVDPGDFGTQGGMVTNADAQVLH
jgi:hypothetical protein